LNFSVFVFQVLVSFLLGIYAHAQGIPLSSLKPVEAYSYVSGQSPSPVSTTLSIRSGAPLQPALRFGGEVKVSYMVPTGQNVFTGVLVSEPKPLNVPNNEFEAFTKIHVLVAVDGKVVLERGMDSPLPPMEFTIHVSAGQKLTISSLSTFAGTGGTFSLVNARFDSQDHPQSSGYLPDSGKGYVDCTPLPRQAVVGAFFPGEPVSVAVTFAGATAAANVRIQVSPLNRDAPTQTDLPVKLSPGQSGVARGSVTWQVPNRFGPATLTVEELVNGTSVYHRQLRIAVIPQIDLSQVTTSTFGLHISGNGYPFLYDEFAYLWGAKWARLFVRWPIIEPAAGKIDFVPTDAIVELYRSQHMLVLPALGEDSPAWAGPPGSPAFMTAWQNYVSQEVNHFVGRVRFWDVFNEVDVKYGSPNIKESLIGTSMFFVWRWRPFTG
jgi:hypothetical protein